MTFLEISQWRNPRSLLVVNELGRLRRLNCPFLVICIDGVGELTVFKLYVVDYVKVTKEGFLVYEISGSLYFHSSFKIVDQ